MSKALPVFTFIFGAGIGAAGSWYFLKNYYDQKTQEEINSVKELYSKKNEEKIEEKTEIEEEKEVDLKEYYSIAKEKGYVKTDYNAISKKDISSEETLEEEGEDVDISEPSEESNQKEPYVIYPEEYGERENYKTLSLVYYSDGVLADEQDNVISDDDVAETVGIDFAKHIGDYEDDAVHIRNEYLQSDYEILVDIRSWSDILKFKPH